VSRVVAADKVDLTRRLSAAFPNLSVIDVSRVVEQFGEIAGRLAGALRFMAGLAMVTGLVAVFAIARQEALRREREINLLRVLGASVGRVRLLTMLEFGMVGAAAGLSALLLSLAASWAVAWLLFDRLWRFDWPAGATLVCAGTALFAADSVLRRRPVALLG
jgi:putative ABC transport system permease protein